MNTKKSRIVSLALAVALVCGATGVTTFAVTGDSGNKSSAETAAQLDPNAPVVKDETVYIIANADGSAKKIIVSDEIKNASRETAENAVAELDNVENVKGDDCWMGTSDERLPVELNVTYRLDGKEISAEELAGKSGRVTIRFDYENRQYRTVDIGGEKTRIYVPFAALTGAVLKNDCFKNVEITNGKIMTDGNRTVVIGIALPGLQESLALDRDKLELPDCVEITADVSGFKLDTTFTVVTNSLFNKADAGELDEKLGEGMEGGVSVLTDALGQLADGTSALYDGLCTLLEKSGELSDGVNQLSGGLSELASHNEELNAGARQVFESLLEVANSQLASSGLDVPTLTIDNYSDVLTRVLAELGVTKDYASGVARGKVEQAVRANTDIIRAQVTQGVKSQVSAAVTAKIEDTVWAGVLASMGMSQAEYDAAVAAGLISTQQKQMIEAGYKQQLEKAMGQLDNAVAARMESAEIKALIEQKTEEQVQALIGQNMSSQEVQNQIAGAASQAASGARSIAALKEQLDSYNKFYSGLTEYTDGVAKASRGAKQLNANMPALLDGVTQLRDGAMQLNDGLASFGGGDAGKLLGAFGGELEERLRALEKASKDYTSFTGLTGDMDGSVRFVYRTESIEAADEK